MLNEVFWPLRLASLASFQLLDASWGLSGRHQSITATLARVVVLERKRSQIMKTFDLWNGLSVPTDMTLILQQEKPMALYPKLFSTEAVIPCDCGNMQCDSVYWFRTLPASGQVQFLGKLNNANVASHVPSVKPAHFDLKRKTKTLFLLKIRNVTEEDTGVYSCVLKDRKTTEVWKSGILLLPGGLWEGRSPCLRGSLRISRKAR